MTNGQPQPDELLSALHDGELSVAERAAAERLLEDSADARAELEDYRALTELLRTLPTDKAPDGLRASVMRRIERESLLAAPASIAKNPRRSMRSRLILIAGSLATVAGLLLAFVNFDGGPAPPRGLEVAQRDAPRASNAAGAEAMTRLSRTEDRLDEMSASDSVPESLALLGSGGDAALAGSAARPPEGFSVGDVYTYLGQTADGDVMVVQATVVNVRLALNEIQVLLNRHSIPMVPVGLSDEYGASGASAEAAAANPNSDLALYVESDQEQMNEALVELSQASNLFVQMQYAGVLDPAAPSLNQQSLGTLNYAQSPGRSLGEARDEVEELDREAALGKNVRPQARASVPAQRFRVEPPAPAEASREILTTRDDADSIPLDTNARRFSMPVEDLDSKEAGAEMAELKNGYQTVLNVPLFELKQQMTPPKTANQAKKLADEAGTTEFFSRDQAGQRGADRAESMVENEVRGLAAKSGPPVQRRLRLLVVLESQPDSAKALKARSDLPAGPVEAPLPARKKG